MSHFDSRSLRQALRTNDPKFTNMGIPPVISMASVPNNEKSNMNQPNEEQPILPVVPGETHRIKWEDDVRGTHGFSRFRYTEEEAKQVARDLNRDYSHINHMAVPI